LKISEIDYGSIPGLLCPSKSLLNLNIKQIDNIVNKIESNNINIYNKINPDKLILGTPESYDTFKKLKDYINIEILPKILYSKLKDFKDFNPIKKTISIHSACHMDKDPFYEYTKKILQLIPEITIIDIDGKCKHNGFDDLNADSKSLSLKLLEEANKKEVDTIICTSPYCLSHFQLYLREGSWRTIDTDINDAYSFILDSIFKGDI
jgi:Fe-S oxidoreductase